MKKKHRGRFQAQGKDLEESEAWAQDDPLTVKEALTLLEKLKTRLKELNRKQYEIRIEAFRKAERYIHQSGGLSALFKKSFRVFGTKNERVDIEVLGGTAFVPDHDDDSDNQN